MRRDLFVFAGQSNMMGAAVYPPRMPVACEHSFEYKHKARRLGADAGEFVPATYPAGEFSYSDLSKAYAPDMVNERGESLLTDYAQNTFFCPSMFNLKSEETKELYPFVSFSEANTPAGVTLAPMLAQRWEEMGHACAYIHAAKGGVLVAHYMTDEMARRYEARIAEQNRTEGTSFKGTLSGRMAGAADYFFEKCRDFFADAEQRFAEDDMSNRCFFWLQGESDARDDAREHEIKLEVLWEALKEAGFTHFFCLRVDFWGDAAVSEVMRAQEDFVSRHEHAYMLTRAASYFPFVGQDTAGWFLSPPTEEYEYCRDSFFGFANQHVNERGFALLAERCARNLERVLCRGEQPLLEAENICALTAKAE